MNSKERVMAALNNEQPDRVPIFEAQINELSILNLSKLLLPKAPKMKAAKGRFGEESLRTIDLYCFLVKELKLDATCYTFSMGLKRVSENHGRDKYGIIYRLSEHGEPFPIEGPIRSYSDLKGFSMLPQLQLDDFSRFQYIINKVGKNKAHFIMVPDPFKVSWFLRGGMQNLLTDYLADPQLAHDLARISLDFNMASIDIAVRMGVDVIFLVGDLAGERTTLMSPEHYREYLKSYHNEIVNYTHQKGAKIVKHSDGNVWPILNDLMEVGFDGIHPIQPQCMEIAEVKEYLHGRMCILGNIDCRNLLPFGTKEEVRKAVKETIKKAALRGGYIISSSNSIHPGCKPENYITMVEATHEYGIYQ